MPEAQRERFIGNVTDVLEMITNDPVGAGTHFWNNILPNSKLLYALPWLLVMKYAAHKFKRRAEAKWDREEMEEQLRQQQTGKKGGGAKSANKAKRK